MIDITALFSFSYAWECRCFVDLVSFSSHIGGNNKKNLKRKIEKDDRHDSMVTLSGGLLYPIVVETFGTWSPYSLEVIKTIARKMSLVSSLSISKIVCNIHEQLSVRLWQYNAKMVLDKLHLAYSDMDLDYI